MLFPFKFFKRLWGYQVSGKSVRGGGGGGGETGKWPRAAAAYKRLLRSAHGPFIIFSQNPDREEVLQEIPVAPAALNAVPEPADLDGDFHTVLQKEASMMIEYSMRPSSEVIIYIGIIEYSKFLTFRSNTVFLFERYLTTYLSTHPYESN
jgi:hypothetical protein